MDLGINEDQIVLQEVFSNFFKQEAGPEKVRDSEPLGFDLTAWERLAETGAPGMGVAEPRGGGASLTELIIVAEECGAQISPLPIIDHIVTTRILEKLNALDDDVISGSLISGLAIRSTKNGTAFSVPAGAVVSKLVALETNKLILISSDPPGIALPNHGDLPIAHRELKDPILLLEGPDAISIFNRALDEWKTLVASLLVGITRSAIEIGVQYVNERQQFGRPIGSFQAVQHGLADLPGLCDGARLLVGKAAWSGDNNSPGEINIDENEVTDFSALSSMALIFAGEAALKATDRSLHYHGGYGFAEEYDIQLYYRKARAWSQILGDPSKECLHLADLLLDSKEVN